MSPDGTSITIVLAACNPDTKLQIEIEASTVKVSVAHVSVPEEGPLLQMGCASGLRLGIGWDDIRGRDLVDAFDQTVIPLSLDPETWGVEECAAPEGSSIDLGAEPSYADSESRRWADPAGCLVRVDVILHDFGIAHCFQGTEFLIIGEELGEPFGTFENTKRFVFNTDGVIRGMTPGRTMTRTELPTTVVPSGFWHEHRVLLVDPENPDVLFVLEGDIALEFVHDQRAGLCL